MVTFKRSIHSQIEWMKCSFFGYTRLLKRQVGELQDLLKKEMRYYINGHGRGIETKGG